MWYSSHVQICKQMSECLWAGGSGRVELKMVPSLPLLSCELSMSVKEITDRKKKKKREFAFYEIFFCRISVRWIVTNLSILTLKLLNMLKSRLCFKERWQISRVNNPKAIKIENAQFTRFFIWASLCSAFSISVLVCL